MLVFLKRERSKTGDLSFYIKQFKKEIRPKVNRSKKKIMIREQL